MKWQDTDASKGKWSQYTQEMFHNWDIIWDQSTSSKVEFLASKDGMLAYMEFAPSSLDRLSEEECRRALGFYVDVYDNILNFRSFIEIKNDDRLRKLKL